jgi:LmbE family N-acetylglucosaminyl deacetylase
METKPADTIPQRVLVIVAHPDDIEFGLAGSVARWADAGAWVTYCIVTDGAAGSNAPGADLRELARTRQAEQCAAAEVVGVKDVRFLGYPDGVLQATLELRRDLTRLIREIRPDRVVCQDPTTIFFGEEYLNHPDHRAAGEAALYAVFPSAGTRPIFPELLGEGLEPHDIKDLYLTLTEKPTHHVDISSTIDRKIQALLCHATQVNEEVGGWVREWNAEAGKEIGVAYAERFRVMRFVEDEETGPTSPD